MAPQPDEEAEAAIMALLEARGPDKSICPSEAARALASEGWREQMPRIRAVAERLERAGRLEASQKGERVCLATAKGALRLRLPRKPQKPGEPS